MKDKIEKLIEKYIEKEYTLRFGQTQTIISRGRVDAMGSVYSAVIADLRELLKEEEPETMRKFILKT